MCSVLASKTQPHNGTAGSLGRLPVRVVVWVGDWIGYSAIRLVWVVWVFVWVDVWVVWVVWVRETLACQLEYCWSLYISGK